jgi:ribose/xylose/arabinose/galactoside ABC-type transport system permease subunit
VTTKEGPETGLMLPKDETFHNPPMKELSAKRSQMGRIGGILRRKFPQDSDSSNARTARFPKVLTAAGLLRWGLRVVLLVGMLVLIDIYAPRFFRYQNVINILLQASLLGLMTIGMTVVMIAGGIDLSLPANMAIGAVLGAMYMRSGGSWIVSCCIMVAVGLVVGLVNGIAVSRLKMIPFVVTLAMMTILSGSAVWLTNSLSISQIADSFLALFDAAPIFGIPVTIWLAAAVTVIGTVVMRSTMFGRWVYAVGLNARAARVAGVPVERVILVGYVISGLMAGLTSILLTARLGSASANMGNDGVVLDIVSACVVGGVSIYGGAGRVPGAVFGAVLITVLSNAMNLVGVSYYLSLIIKGAVIIAFVAIEGREGSGNE